MNTIIVAGGAGFLGSHLCRRLINEGNQVICVDNFQTGRAENIHCLMKSDYFRLLKHDIEDKLELEEPIDMIYNLACPASPQQYQKDPIKTIMTNVVGTNNLLDLAVRNNATLLQASTSEIYGEPLEHPQSESYRGNVNPIGVRACYDEGKRCAETLCFDYHRKHNVKVKVVRIFNTYGPNMDPADGRVVSNFIIQALRGEDITVYGDGGQTRSFCYVDDLIEGLIRAIRLPSDIIGPINLGNPKEFTILELAEKVILLTSSKSKIAFESLPPDDPTQRKPNINKARELLGWTPEKELEAGLYSTIQYYMEQQRLQNM